MRGTKSGVILLFIAAAACAERAPTDPRMLLDAELLAAKGGPTAVTTDWGLPIADAGLTVKSDGQFSDGTYSWYRNGTCTFVSNLLLEGSGDNPIRFDYQKTKPKPSCGRRMTLVFPDAFTETLAYQGGVQILQSSTFRIPIGGQAKRHMRLGADQIARSNPAPSRCGLGLVFGEGGHNPALGSDSVVVSRIDARTWRVQSQPAPDNLAFCIDNGQLYAMTLDFVIVASRDVP